jgi:O-antigen ligase
MMLAYIISLIVSRVRRPATGLAVVLSVLIGLNLISIGSIYIAPVHTLVDAIMSDPTFTGRSDIWKFAIDHVAQRPITGYGFSAFWGTDEVVYGMAGATWANTASHAHNGYLDFALTIGIPGSLLFTVWLVVLPVVDYYRARPQPHGAALRMFFLRICLFAAYESCFETLFTLVGALWLILFSAVFGLRFAALSRVSD